MSRQCDFTLTEDLTICVSTIYSLVVSSYIDLSEQENSHVLCTRDTDYVGRVTERNEFSTCRILQYDLALTDASTAVIW